MAGSEPVSTVERPGPEAISFVSKTFIQADAPRVKVFFVIRGVNPNFGGNNNEST